MITLRLDKNGGINKGDVQAFEHDNLSEVYIIQLYKNGAIYDLTNKSIELTMVERKRKIGDMVTLPIYNATEGKIKLEVVSDITKQDGIYDFKLTVKDTTGLIETFPNFQVKIKNDITDSITGEIIQDPNFTILTEGLKALADYNIYKTNALKVPEIEQDIVEINEQLDTKVKEFELNFENVENNKSDIKTELLDTLVCDANFFRLTNNTSYPILQGGCLSDDGLNYYCCLITAGGGNEKGIIQKYSVGSISNFSTWEYVNSSIELDLSHGNDMQYFNGKIYLCNTNTRPTEIIIINPSSLVIENTINIKYGATAITFNKKLNQFITRRKTERGIFDFYDSNFNYIKSSQVVGVTYDTVQGIDSDDSYIYELCSDLNFGNSVIAYDLKGNFIKRIGSNVMSEVESMSNFNSYYILGFYKNGSNFLAIATIRTDKRLTGARYTLNHGRNTVLTGSTVVWNGDIPLNFSKKYFSHLSFNITVDGVDVETKIIDLTNNPDSRILNTFRLTGSGQIIFYRSLLSLNHDNKINILPVVLCVENPDGTRIIKLYSKEPNEFNKTNSIGISNICGQILCGQRISE